MIPYAVLAAVALVVATVAFVAIVLNLRRIPYAHHVVLGACAVFALSPFLHYLLTSRNGPLFLLGAIVGVPVYQAHVRKREEALAEAARRRAIREQYRAIGC